MVGLKLANDDSGEIKQFDAGTVLFVEGQEPKSLFIIVSGQVRLFKLVAGRQVTQLLKGPKDFLGDVAVLLKENHHYTAVVESDAEIIEIPASDIHQVMTLCPEWVPNIMLTLGERLMALRELMRDHRIDDPSTSAIGEISNDRDVEITAAIEAFKREHKLS